MLVTCTKCSNAIEATTNFCSTCGTPTGLPASTMQMPAQTTANPARPQPNTKPVRSMKSTYKIMGIAAAGILVLIGFAVFSQKQSNAGLDQEELDKVSDTLAVFMKNAHAQETMSKNFYSAMGAGVDNHDVKAIHSAADIYLKEAQEEKESVSALQIPKIENRNADRDLHGAYKALSLNAELQVQEAELMLKTSSDEDDGHFSEHFDDIKSRKDKAMQQIVIHVLSSLAEYGFNADAYDHVTYRIKPGTKPSWGKLPEPRNE